MNTFYDTVDELAKGSGCEVRKGPLGRPFYTMTATELIQFSVALVHAAKDDPQLQELFKE